MIIRKEFKFEGAHVVRNCSTDRCQYSIHGHSYIVEVFLRGDLDNGMMVLDFSLFKPVIGAIIDSFDHTYVVWSEDKKYYKDKIKELSARWIDLPVSPSAEGLAMWFHAAFKLALDKMEFKNGEKDVQLVKVRVHETRTGWAETEGNESVAVNKEAAELLIKNTTFSVPVMSDWKDKSLINNLIE